MPRHGCRTVGASAAAARLLRKIKPTLGSGGLAHKLRLGPQYLLGGAVTPGDERPRCRQLLQRFLLGLGLALLLFFARSSMEALALARLDLYPTLSI